MPSLWLSVLIPVYNVQAHLNACIDSVATQAQAGVEIVLLDDASTDGSAKLMQAAQARWPQCQIRLLAHPHNQGLSAARNSLLEAAQGEYVWFVDSDDLLMPGAIAGLRRAIETHAPDLVLCDFKMLRQHTSFKHRLRGEGHRRTFAGPASTRIENRDALLAGLLITGQLHAWSKISKHALWKDDLRFPVGRYFEDMATMPRLTLRANSAVYCQQPWLGYRQHGNSILANVTLSRMDDLSSSLRLFREEWHQLLPPAAHPARQASAFAASHLAARNFSGCMKAWQHSDQQAATAVQFWQDFTASSVLTLSELMQAYVRRGWWLRAWRLRQCVHIAQQQMLRMQTPVSAPGSPHISSPAAHKPDGL